MSEYQLEIHHKRSSEEILAKKPSQVEKSRGDKGPEGASKGDE